LKAMFAQQCLPRLEQRVPKQIIRTFIMRVAGMPESDLDQLISPVYKKYENPMTTILAAAGDIQVHLRARCGTESDALALLSEVAGPIGELLGDKIYSRNGEPLEVTVGGLLRENRATVSVAESCTGGLLAEELGLPCVSFVDTIETADGVLRLERQTDSGWEMFEATTPVVVTVTNDEHNVPRIPKVRDVMMSYRQPLTQWTLADLGYEVEDDKYYEVVDLSIPQKESRCEFVTGDTLDERVESLAKRITEVTSAL